MLYRITSANSPGNWAELRECLGGVEMRHNADPTWHLCSNVKTLEECADEYRTHPNYFVTAVPVPVAVNKIDTLKNLYTYVMRYGSAGIKVDYAEQTPTTAKHKCTCPWDGSTGVYAMGCKCNGI